MRVLIRLTAPINLMLEINNLAAPPETTIPMDQRSIMH